MGHSSHRPWFLVIVLFLLYSVCLVGAVNPDHLSEDRFVQAYFNMYGDYLSGTKNVSKAELSDVIGYYMASGDIARNLHYVGPNSGEMIGSILANSGVDFDCGACDASVLNQRCCVYRAGEKPMMYECVGSEVKTVSGYGWKNIYECSFGCCNNKCCRDSNPTTTVEPTTSTVRSTTTTSSGSTTTTGQDNCQSNADCVKKYGGCYECPAPNGTCVKGSSNCESSDDCYVSGWKCVSGCCVPAGSTTTAPTTTTAATTTTGQATTTTRSTTSTTASSGTTSTTTSGATTTTVPAGKFCEDCTPVGECSMAVGYRCVDGNRPELKEDSSCTSSVGKACYDFLGLGDCILVGQCSHTPGFRCVWEDKNNPPIYKTDSSCGTPTPAGECVTLVNNGDPKDKADIVFIGARYGSNGLDQFVNDVKKDTDTLFSMEPFKSNKNKFNVYYVKKLLDYRPLDMQQAIVNVVSDCPWTHPIVIDNDADWSAQSCGNFYTSISAKEPAILHEFGHCFGDLADEYYYDDIGHNCTIAPPVEHAPNCDLAGCQRWAGTPGTGCYKGCGGGCSDWYKPWPDDFDNGDTPCQMNFAADTPFCPVCTKRLLSVLNKYK